MQKRLLIFVLVFLPAASTADEPTLTPIFQKLVADLRAGAPESQLQKYFLPGLIAESGSQSTRDYVNSAVSRVAEPEKLVERIEGNEGCVAYAIPYKTPCSEDWFNLSTYSFTLNNGKWLISDAMPSAISPVFNALESGDLCARLGWPWKEAHLTTRSRPTPTARP